MVLTSPNEEEINVQNVLARQVRDLSKRVQHLETLDALSNTNDFVALDKVELAAPAATITFTNISQIYAALKIVMFVATDRANAFDSIQMNFNNDTGGNYDSLRSTIRAVASLGTAESIAANGIDRIGLIRASGAGPDDAFSPVELIIPGYANATREKTIIGQTANKDANSSTNIRHSQFSGWWRDTSAITEIDLTPVDGTNFVADSSFYLYGLKESA